MIAPVPIAVRAVPRANLALEIVSTKDSVGAADSDRGWPVVARLVRSEGNTHLGGDVVGGVARRAEGLHLAEGVVAEIEGVDDRRTEDMSLRKVVVASHRQIVVSVVAEHLCSSVVRVVPDVVESEVVFRADVVIDAKREVVLSRGAAEDGRGEVVNTIDRRGNDRGVLKKDERLRTEQVWIYLIVGEGQASEGI